MAQIAILPKGKFNYKNVASNLIKKDGKKVQRLI